MRGVVPRGAGSRAAARPPFKRTCGASATGSVRKTFPTLAAAKSWRLDAMKALKDGRMRAPTPETIRQAGEALIAGMKGGSVRKRGGKLYKPSRFAVTRRR
jgi:hypothetical protein